MPVSTRAKRVRCSVQQNNECMSAVAAQPMPCCSLLKAINVSKAVCSMHTVFVVVTGLCVGTCHWKYGCHFQGQDLCWFCCQWLVDTRLVVVYGLDYTCPTFLACLWGALYLMPGWNVVRLRAPNSSSLIKLAWCLAFCTFDGERMHVGTVHFTQQWATYKQ